jgi:hypothetical protein
VATLVGLGGIERYYRSGAEKSHRNHLGSHCEHALVSPYSVVRKVFETDEESSRPHALCRAVTYGEKRPKIDSQEVIERRFGKPCPKTAAKVKTCLETET